MSQINPVADSAPVAHPVAGMLAAIPHRVRITKRGKKGGLIAQGRFDASATLVLSPTLASLVPALRSRFPDAVIESHPGNAPGEVAFFVFRPPKE